MSAGREDFIKRVVGAGYSEKTGQDLAFAYEAMEGTDWEKNIETFWKNEQAIRESKN